VVDWYYIFSILLLGVYPCSPDIYNVVKLFRKLTSIKKFVYSISNNEHFLPPTINEPSFIPYNADFNQISSVRAKRRYWQEYS
jgi:hypothetical protein